MPDKEVQTKQTLSDDENERPDTALDHFFTLAFSIGLFWLAYALIRWLASTILGVAERIQHTAADPYVAIPIGIAILISGALLYWFREHYLKWYAILELGSAFGAAVESCYRFGAATTDPAFLFTILGSLYIAVRGFDNLAKAHNKR